jgi:hypothetical protein
MAVEYYVNYNSHLERYILCWVDAGIRRADDC